MVVLNIIRVTAVIIMVCHSKIFITIFTSIIQKFNISNSHFIMEIMLIIIILIIKLC